MCVIIIITIKIISISKDENNEKKGFLLLCAAANNATTMKRLARQWKLEMKQIPIVPRQKVPNRGWIATKKNYKGRE